MKFKTVQWALLPLMLVTSLVAFLLKPTQFLSDLRPQVKIDELIPRQFEGWQELAQSTGSIVNPQSTELLNKIYSQMVSRTYVNDSGRKVMLSVAYGENQSKGVALHYPEICYPAQGFQVTAEKMNTLETPFGSIEIKQLVTQLGTRHEPVTYWTTLGDKVVMGGLKTKLEQLNFGFHGTIPDGLIFRVSSINKNTDESYEDQAAFVRSLLTSLSASSRLRMAGLAN